MLFTYECTVHTTMSSFHPINATVIDEYINMSSNFINLLSIEFTKLWAEEEADVLAHIFAQRLLDESNNYDSIGTLIVLPNDILWNIAQTLRASC